uniref:G protein-coupled receptor n=1 Tax=Haemonchus contortus TaxID=6289 RepID=A0A7I4YQA1_HAECO
ADIASLFSGCTIRMISELNVGEDSKDLALLFFMITYTAFIAHLIGNMLITVNRYSALCLINRYNMIWTRKNTWIAVITQYVISFAVFAHVARGHIEVVHSADGEVFVKGIQEKQIDMIVRYTYIGACIIYATTSLTLYLRLLIEWKRLSKIDDGLKNSYHDKGLLIYALLVFIGSMLVCSQQFVKAIAVLTDNTSLNLQAAMLYSWMNNFMVSIPPISLLMLSSDFRNEIVNFFQCVNCQSSVALFVTLPTYRRSVVERF